MMNNTYDALVKCDDETYRKQLASSVLNKLNRIMKRYTELTTEEQEQWLIKIRAVVKELGA